VRGKHQRARQRHRDDASSAEMARLHREIEAETQRAAAAPGLAAQSRAARTRLAREQATNARQLRRHEKAALKATVHTAPGAAAVADALQELRSVDEQLTRFTTDDPIRQAARAGLKIRMLDVHRSATEPYRDVDYRKKTRRTRLSTRDVYLSGWIPDDTPNDTQALAPYATCTVHDITPQACWTWAVPPWMRIPTDTGDAPELRSHLGATNSGAPVPANEPFPGPPLRPDAVITTPWRHAPAVGQSGDAVDLAYWYRRSTWAQQWRAEIMPVPFWLPTEHSISYPDARALPPGVGIRLPYPLVFAAFAEPWRIEPNHADLPDHLAAIQALMFYARGSAAARPPDPLHDVLGRLQATGLTDRTQVPTPLEALDHFGGTVEGLLLTADPDGTPGDHIAWCLCINHPSGFPLARIAIPASRNSSEWKTQIDNIIAGIALSCWHQPTGTPTQPTSTRGAGHPDQDLVASTVHILDIDATSPLTPRRDGRRTGRSPRPHLRRGHFRRRSRNGNTGDTGWIWVRPTTVNGTGITTQQVYVLRRQFP
jgi:hypothetical protein